jgi:transposase
MTRTTRSTELITVEEPKAKRRFRSKQERRQIVEESLRPGASVAVIARRNGVNSHQVFHWRKLYREGRLDAESTPAQLMPVRIAEIVPEEDRSIRAYPGTIHIELGKARVRLEGSVDPASLRLILEHFAGKPGR